MSSHLRLVEFNPNDYSLGDALLSAETTRLTDKQALTSALSLYFQWPQHRSALIYSSKSNLTFSCEIDRDQDESEASVLFVRITSLEKEKFTNDEENLRIRFEIFRTCYEFTTSILGRAEDNGGENWDLAIGIPEELILFKHRRLPRVKVSKKISDEFSFQFRSQIQSDVQLVVTEMSMRSLVVQTDVPLSEGPGSIYTNNLATPVTVIRTKDTTSILVLNFESGDQSGLYFDYYRSAAYPCLRPRKDVDYLKLLELYKKTGYLDRYQPTDDEARETNEIIETWRELDLTENHNSVADYVACDQNERLVGSSGLAKAFKRNGRDVWFLNQLCALTEPDLLEESGALYQWRSEYLVGRPEELTVAGRYWSGSRWLERIYTKFSFIVTSVELKPVATFRKTFTSESTSDLHSFIKVGRWNRPILDSSSFMGGVLPSHLNLSTALDTLICIWDDQPLEEIENAARSLVKSSGNKNHAIALALKHGVEGPKDAYRGKTDRIAFFEKSSLVEFLTSVEHIIAVTRRKHGSN